MIVLFLFVPYWHYLIESNRIIVSPLPPPPMPLASRLPNQVRGVEWQIF